MFMKYWKLESIIQVFWFWPRWSKPTSAYLSLQLPPKNPEQNTKSNYLRILKNEPKQTDCLKTSHNLKNWKPPICKRYCWKNGKTSYRLGEYLENKQLSKGSYAEYIKSHWKSPVRKQRTHFLNGKILDRYFTKEDTRRKNTEASQCHWPPGKCRSKPQRDINKYLSEEWLTRYR